MLLNAVLCHEEEVSARRADGEVCRYFVAFIFQLCNFHLIALRFKSFESSFQHFTSRRPFASYVRQLKNSEAISRLLLFTN